jgi:acyl dehydratase
VTPPVIDAAIVGLTVGPLACTVDARWLMAYAAALGETDARYYDTTAPGGPAAHPLFPVCYEWPAAMALRAKAIDDRLALLGVHAQHTLVVHRAPRAGDSLRTRAQVTAVRQRRRGTLVVVRYATVDRTGVPVSTTDYASLYRGVALRGEDAEASSAPTKDGDAGAIRWVDEIDVPAHTAHVYTEGARIYNPIHTDIAVARAAGLPGLILHGTATLALAVSRVIARDLAGDPTAVRGVAGHFTGMVTMPSRLGVRGRARRGSGLAFDVVEVAGQPVLSDGLVMR